LGCSRLSHSRSSARRSLPLYGEIERLDREAPRAPAPEDHVH
jgi:hypothetical protein